MNSNLEDFKKALNNSICSDWPNVKNLDLLDRLDALARPIEEALEHSKVVYTLTVSYLDQTINIKVDFDPTPWIICLNVLDIIANQTFDPIAAYDRAMGIIR